MSKNKNQKPDDGESAAVEAAKVAAAAAEEAAQADLAVAEAQALKAKRDADALEAAKTRAIAPATAREVSTDVRVVCLRDAPTIRLGNRNYTLSKGSTVSMNPSHALTLEQKGWVIGRG